MFDFKDNKNTRKLYTIQLYTIDWRVKKNYQIPLYQIYVYSNINI